jgi:hypothetical protein
MPSEVLMDKQLMLMFFYAKILLLFFANISQTLDHNGHMNLKHKEHLMYHINSHKNSIPIQQLGVWLQVFLVDLLPILKTVQLIFSTVVWEFLKLARLTQLNHKMALFSTVHTFQKQTWHFSNIHALRTPRVLKAMLK